MHKTLLLATAILAVCLASCKSKSTNMGFAQADDSIDTINVYELRFENGTYLFSQYDTFIAEVGLPSKVSAGLSSFSVTNASDLSKIINENVGSSLVDLHYDGFSMGYFPNGRMVMDYIDFRKTDKRVYYSNMVFDQSYTAQMFAQHFPKSAAQTFDIPSLFSSVTGETDSNLKHFMVLRRSIDDPLAEPIVEFTFKDNKLIYIFFANF